MGSLSVELVKIPGAHLGDHAAPVGHDVGGVFRLDGADVAGGLAVDAQQVHAGDGRGHDLNGTDALLRGKPGVGPAADHVGKDLDLARGLYNDLAHIAAGVEDIGPAGLQLGAVKGLRAPHAALFADGEDDLRRAVAQLVFQDHAHGLQNAADAALVIAAQNGGAVGIDHAVADNGIDANAGDHGVHVGGEHDGLPLSRQAGKDVEAVGAEGLAGAVSGYLQPQGRQHLHQLFPHFSLVSAFAVDLYKLQEFVEKAGLVDHSRTLLSNRWGKMGARPVIFQKERRRRTPPERP